MRGKISDIEKWKEEEMASLRENVRDIKKRKDDEIRDL